MKCAYGLRVATTAGLRYIGAIEGRAGVARGENPGCISRRRVAIETGRGGSSALQLLRVYVRVVGPVLYEVKELSRKIRRSLARPVTACTIELCLYGRGLRSVRKIRRGLS